MILYFDEVSCSISVCWSNTKGTHILSLLACLEHLQHLAITIEVFFKSSFHIVVEELSLSSLNKHRLYTLCINGA